MTFIDGAKITKSHNSAGWCVITVQTDKSSAAAWTCSVRDCRRAEQTADYSFSHFSASSAVSDCILFLFLLSFLSLIILILIIIIMSTFIPCKINSPQMQYCVIIFCCHYMMNKDYNNNNNNNECWPQVRRGVYWSGVHACHVRTVSDWTAATATVYVSTTRTGVVRWRLIASLWNMRPSTSAQRPISTAAHPPSPRSSSKVRTACLLIFRLCRGVTRLFGRRPGRSNEIRPHPRKSSRGSDSNSLTLFTWQPK